MGRIRLIAKSRFKEKTAVTLVELLIVSMLVMLVFASGITAIIAMMQFLKAENTESIATEHLSNALEWIKKDAIRSDEADTSSPNSVTLYIYDYTGMNATVIHQIRYLVVGNTQLLRRQLLPLPQEDRLVTDMISQANPPDFNITEDNYLSVGIWINDPDTGASAHCRTGFMLRCRATY
jgi:type II secretory pathway pseudopilin PulG